MKLIYYPGCTLKNSARNFDVSTVSSMAELDVEVEELDRWNCCGTVHALGAENVMNRVAPVTNLIRVKETAAKTEGMASEFMTSCAMCYNTLKRANIDVKKNPDKLSTINEFLNLETHHARCVHHLVAESRITHKVTGVQIGRVPANKQKAILARCDGGCATVLLHQFLKLAETRQARDFRGLEVRRLQRRRLWLLLLLCGSLFWNNGGLRTW